MNWRMQWMWRWSGEGARGVESSKRQQRLPEVGISKEKCLKFGIWWVHEYDTFEILSEISSELNSFVRNLPWKLLSFQNPKHPLLVLPFGPLFPCNNSSLHKRIFRKIQPPCAKEHSTLSPTRGKIRDRVKSEKFTRGKDKRCSESN